MATQTVENRTERVVVLMTPSEKAALVERARAHRLGTAEFVRLAAGHYDPDDAAELEQLAELMQELHAANARAQMSFERFEAQRAAIEDETTMRARIRAEVEARTDIDWDRLHTVLTGQA